MRILNLYVTRGLVLITLMAIGILTFVMLSANLVKAFELLSKGADIGLILRFLMYMLPEVLTFTIPMALLCATVLVFSRLAADNELIAMQASGVSLWQIVAPGLVLSVFLSAFCMWLHASVGPRWKYYADQLRRGEAAKAPLLLLEPGRFIELPGFVIRVGGKEGNRLEDIHVYGLAPNGRVAQDITARTGILVVDEEKRTLDLELHDTTIAAVDVDGKAAASSVTRFASKELSFPLDYGAALDRRPLSRRRKYKDFSMILGEIYLQSAWGEDTLRNYVELHSRMAMALSPFAFVLLGIPFGIRTRRSETSVGLLLSLVLASVFYVFLMIADGLKSQPSLHPEILVWVPNVLYQVGGLWAIAAIDRK